MPQLHDPVVQALFKRWKKQRWPMEYAALNQVADIILPGGKPDARLRVRIVAAAEAAGVRFHNYDELRRRMAAREIHIQFTGEGMHRIVEEWRWRAPEEWLREMEEVSPDNTGG